MRNDAIISAYKSGGYTLKEVRDYFNLHYSTVSGIVKNHKPDPTDSNFRNQKSYNTHV